MRCPGHPIHQERKAGHGQHRSSKKPQRRSCTRLGPAQPRPAIRPTNTGSPPCRRTPTARPTVTKKIAKPTLVEEGPQAGAAGGRHQKTSPGEGNRNPGASGMLSPGSEKHHQTQSTSLPALTIGKAMKNRSRQRPGSAQNQKRRHGKKSEEERQEENHEWQVRRIVLNHAPADVISRRSQQRGPGHPLPLVSSPSGKARRRSARQGRGRERSHCCALSTAIQG